jgi:Mycothiol maleylpyruvate isomerase N-terminal domain
MRPAYHSALADRPSGGGARPVGWPARGAAMTSVRPAYDAAAEFAVGLLRAPAVADHWAEPSALPEMTVGALAAHLARQVFNVQLVLAESLDPEPPISLLEHYARVAWVGAGLQDPANVAIREDSENTAAAGPAGLAASSAAAASELRAQLATEPADRVVLLPWGPWSLTLDDMLITRIMEIAVHSDDLTCSVGLPDVQLPEAVADIATGLLVRLAVRRHGQAAVLRALSREERAPRSIAAF